MSAADRTADMSPDELIAAIERGLAADEDAAKAWLPFGNPDGAARAHIARHDPGRVLADVESKREILAEYKAASEFYGDRPDAPAGEMTGLYFVLKRLARPYLDQGTP